MKVFGVIVKILTALAAVAGAIYLLATYGEQIVQWSKKILSSAPTCPSQEEPETEEPAEEAAAPAEEEPAPEAEPAEEPAPEVVAAPNEPVAEDADFAE